MNATIETTRRGGGRASQASGARGRQKQSVSTQSDAMVTVQPDGSIIGEAPVSAAWMNFFIRTDELNTWLDEQESQK
jgi:hypothetical protein